MAFDFGLYFPRVIEIEGIPKDCVVMIQPPERFYFKRNLSADPIEEGAREIFEYLMQSKSIVIKNIGA